MLIVASISASIAVHAISGASVNPKVLSVTPNPPDLAPVSADGFVKNVGQADPQVLYSYVREGCSFFITRDGYVVDQYQRDGDHRSGHVIRARILDATGGEPTESNPLEGDVNFLQPGGYYSTQKFERAQVSEIRPGISTRFYFDAGSPRYDLIVAPRANLDALRIRYEGADQVTATPDGGLAMRTAFGEYRETGLYAYQWANGKTVSVPVQPQVNGIDVSYRLGPHDRSKPVIIDPQVVVRSSFFGGNSDEVAQSAALSEVGDIAIGGLTTTNQNAGFPVTPGAYNATIRGQTDQFIALFAGRAGSTEAPHPKYILRYCTYINADDLPAQSRITDPSDLTVPLMSIVFGTGNSVAFALSTPQTNLPTSGGGVTLETRPAFKPTGTDIDAYVGMLSADGRRLFGATYYGGNRVERVTAMAIDENRRLVIVGRTNSTDLPIVANRPVQTANAGSNDIFLARIRTNGQTLFTSEYIGGTDYDMPLDVIVSNNNRVVIAGYTQSANFPGTDRGFDSSLDGTRDGIIVRVFSDGGVFSSTYCGSLGNNDLLEGLTNTPSGDIIAVGQVDNAQMQIGSGPNVSVVQPGAWNTRYAGRDGIVIRYNEDLSRRVASTFVGGNSEDIVLDAKANINGRISVVGWTKSTQPNDFMVTPDALPTGVANISAFIVQLNNGLTTATFSTKIPGSAECWLRKVLFIGDIGNVLAVGASRSSNVPMVNAYQSSLRAQDALLIELGYFGDPILLHITRPTVGVGTGTAFAAVFLNFAAANVNGTGGQPVQVSTDRPDLLAPASAQFIIPQGQDRGSIKLLPTSQVIVPTEVTVSILARGTTRTATVTVLPPV